LTHHGRSRQQRYTRLAEWDYIGECATLASDCGLPFFGNGDILSHVDYESHMADNPLMQGCMIGRYVSIATFIYSSGALIKPWIFTEIKERRYWDISSRERLDIMKNFCDYGYVLWVLLY
jgi:tRNA-dihydrouridine synthase 3